MSFFSRLLLASLLCMSLSSPIKALLVTEKFVDVLAQQLGTEPLSSEHEAFVTAIVREMGITKPIKFRYMNLTALNIFGLYNAFAYLDSYVFVSKYFFEKLSQQEQRFVIGHELAHIKQHHAKINRLIAYCALGTAYYGAIKAWQLSKNCSYAQKMGISLSVFLVTRLLAHSVQMYVARYYEYDADRKSALLLHNAQDGISFINHTNYLVQDSSLGQKNPDALPWFKQIFMDHPTNKQRIANLETYITKEILL